MGWHERVFRVLVRLMPAEFRGEYEREMSATFRAERRAAGSTTGLARVWVATVADVFRTAPGEHLDILRRDLGYALRLLKRRPVLTFAAVLTLALGIGANTAIFSVVNGVLFAPLPYADADRLVLIEESRGDRDPGTTGYYSFDVMRSRHRSLEWMAAFASWSAILSGDGQDAERLGGARVSWEFFRTLGVRPALGRDFERAEDHPERRRVAIISDALWRRRYNADPAIVGRPVSVNQLTYTIVGVLPSDLTELITARRVPDAQIWTLLGYYEGFPPACRTCRHIHVVARMRADVTPSQAEADLTRIYQSLSAQFPGDYDRPRAVVTTIRDYFLGPARTPLYLLWSAVGLLLLMACANIANLLLIRASEREEELAIRRALGVSPARMLRQLLTEAIVLALMGGTAGAVLAWWGTSLLTANGPQAIPRIAEVSVDASVLTYALLISVATGILFGMAPARLLVARRGGSVVALGPGGRRSTAGAGAWRYRATLISANVAVSVLLLVGSGLLVSSFVRLIMVDAGFKPSGLLAMDLSLAGQAYGADAGIVRFHDELAERVRALPGVIDVSRSTQLPLTGSIDRAGITIEGRPLDNPAAAPSADRFGVGPDYFHTMGIPLRQGRLFTSADRAGSEAVAIIGETMARRLWPGENAIGRRIRVAGGEGNPMRTIVGIVGDVKHDGLHVPAGLQVYTPHGQYHYPETLTSIVVRTAGSPALLAPQVRDIVRAIDPLQPVTRVRTYEAIVAASMETRRFTLVLLAIFALTALVLAVVGLYGALSYVVSQRQREMGVRVALGAGRREIRSLVVRQGMTPTAVGLVAGVLLSMVAGRVVESMLYGTSPNDAVTFASVLLVMGACALTACLIPARKAAAVDPAVALRAD
jgi:putative ABC transport system permease protein